MITKTMLSLCKGTKKLYLCTKDMKSIRYFICLTVVSVLCCLSCNRDNHTDILPPKTMINVMTDLQQAQGVVMLSKDTIPQISQERLGKYQSDILAHYNITPAKYNKSVNYYSERPKELKKILDGVIKNLQK